MGIGNVHLRVGVVGERISNRWKSGWEDMGSSVTARGEALSLSLSHYVVAAVSRKERHTGAAAGELHRHRQAQGSRREGAGRA